MEWRPVELEQRLSLRLGFRAVLSFSEAAAPAFVFPGADALHVRTSPLLLSAPEDVLEALARFVRAPGDLEARELLLDFTSRGERPTEPDETRGEFHDLAAVFALVNERYFAGRVEARISWSRGAAEKKRHSILFGSYLRSPGEKVGQIKIHPALDQDWVPRGFVEFVVHHECLHAVIPTRCIGGRRAFHPPEFRRREKQYPDYHRWRRWEKENLGRFLGKTALRGGPSPFDGLEAPAPPPPVVHRGTIESTSIPRRSSSR